MGAREYLDELRAAVGKRPLIVAGACVIVRDNAGRVLLHRRRDDGSWDVIGGSMEPGETFEQTVRREARKEIGVELGALEVLEILLNALPIPLKDSARHHLEELHRREAIG